MTAPDPAVVPFSSSACSARTVLDRIGDKWSLQVIYLLGSGTRRFSDMRRTIDGISQRMLTVTLRGLERDGLVIRTVHPTVPPRVDYALTPLGRTLLHTAGALIDWANDHVAEIDAAQAAYDRRAAMLDASLNGRPQDRGHQDAAEAPAARPAAGAAAR
jgi:DNA-binding HxlR family transcriptional regulator